MRKYACLAVLLLCTAMTGCSSKVHVDEQVKSISDISEEDLFTDKKAVREDGTIAGVADDVDVYVPITKKFEVTYSAEDTEWAARKVNIGSGTLDGIPNKDKLEKLGFSVSENLMDLDSTIVYVDSSGNRLSANYETSDWETADIVSLLTMDDIVIFGNDLKKGMTQDQVMETFGQPNTLVLVTESTTQFQYTDSEQCTSIVLLFSDDKLESVKVEYAPGIDLTESDVN